MPVEDFARIAKECGKKTYQIALGGCGDPDQHEHFGEILKLCRENGIVPNFTTSGLGLTEEKAALCKEYCGAVAVSWYRSDYTIRAIRMLLSQGVKTNVHYVLSADTLEEALNRLCSSTEGEAGGFPNGINAVVFLLHKPVGQGSRENIVTIDNEAFWEPLRFLDSEESRKLPFKIGFDSCSVPALLGSKSVDPVSIDTCDLVVLVNELIGRECSVGGHGKNGTFSGSSLFGSGSGIFCGSSFFSGVGRAGDQSKQHHGSQQQSNNFFHGLITSKLIYHL